MPAARHIPPDLVLYHANCPDGFGAAWAYWLALGEAAQYVPMHYDTPVEALPDVAGRHVVMVDVSADATVLEELARRAASFRLLDHHASAKVRLESLPFAHFDLEHSGAWLAWQDASPDKPLPALLRHVEDRDLERFVLPWTREVTFALDCEPRSFPAWLAFSKRLEAAPAAVHTEGAAMGRAFDAAVQRAVSESVSVRLQGASLRLAMAPAWLAPATALALAASSPGLAVGLAWRLDERGMVHLSLRSRHGGPSVLGFAQALGGGGGPHAAAARLTLDEMARWMAGEDVLALRTSSRNPTRHPLRACCT